MQTIVHRVFVTSSRVVLALAALVAPANALDESCKGDCGGATASGCYCDALCTVYGDCCDDYVAYCASPPDCGMASRSWRASIEIEPPSFDIFPQPLPDVGLDAAGDAIAVFARARAGTPTGVFARRFAGGSWRATVRLATGSFAARIAVSQDGSAVVNYGANISRFQPPSSWSALPWPLSAGRGVAAIDGHGKVLMLGSNAGWLESSFFDVATGWQPTWTIGMAPTATVAASPSGIFAAAWREPSGVQLGTFSWPWWTFPWALSATGTLPKLGVSDTGDVLAAWLEGSNLWSQRLSGGVLGPLMFISTNASGPELATNASGAAILTWRDTATTASRVMAAVFSPATGFSTPTQIAPSSIGTDPPASALAVAMDSCGAGHVVFRTSGSRLNAARFTPSTGWSAPTGLEPGLTSAFYYQRLATAPNGIATLVFQYGVGDSVRAMRFE